MALKRLTPPLGDGDARHNLQQLAAATIEMEAMPVRASAGTVNTRESAVRSHTIEADGQDVRQAQFESIASEGRLVAFR